MEGSECATIRSIFFLHFLHISYSGHRRISVAAAAAAAVAVVASVAAAARLCAGHVFTRSDGVCCSAIICDMRRPGGHRVGRLQ